MNRFKIGDRVRVVGVLADFYRGKTGTVVAVEPNAKGIQELDLYRIDIPGFKKDETRLADFQLTLAPSRGTSGDHPTL